MARQARLAGELEQQKAALEREHDAAAKAQASRAAAHISRRISPIPGDAVFSRVLLLMDKRHVLFSSGSDPRSAGVPRGEARGSQREGQEHRRDEDEEPAVPQHARLSCGILAGLHGAVRMFLEIR